MKTKQIETMILGSIKELTKQREYFYYSSIGPEYSHLTDSGKEALTEMLGYLIAKLHQAEALEDVERSKKLVLDELKK